MWPVDYLEPAMFLPFLTAGVLVLIEALKPLLAQVLDDEWRRAAQPWIAGVLGALLALAFVTVTESAHDPARAAVIGFFVGLSAAPVHDTIDRARQAHKR